MNSVRLGMKEETIAYLLNDNFAFDDVGMPMGRSRASTPYFPGSSSLFLAIAMIAGGWERVEGQQFPEDWVVRAEGFSTAL